MKKNVFMLVFAAVVAFSFTSCKKCFQCTVSHAEVGAFHVEPLVTCGEKMDDHKSVLEQTFGCAVCTRTETFGSSTITNTDYFCGTVEDVASSKAAYLDQEDDLTDDVTFSCSDATPTVNCYEAE